MYPYLLSGRDFRKRICTFVPDVSYSVTNIVFGYDRDRDTDIFSEYPITVDTNDLGTIQAYMSKDGTHMFISSKEDIYINSCHSMFEDMKSLVRISFENFHTDKCNNMRKMFKNCPSLLYLNLPNFKTENVTDFSEMFYGCISITFLDIRNFTLSVDSDNCNYIDMFKNLKSLRRFSVGSDFQFSTNMSLSNPDKVYVHETNGLWNNILTRKSYRSDELPSNEACTYYAVDSINSDSDNYMQSFGAMKEMLSQMSVTLSSIASLLPDK